MSGVREQDPVLQRLGRRLRETRRSKGLSIAEVAERSSLSSSFVSLVETGKSDISLGRLLRLLDIYRLPLAELLPREGAATIQVSRAGEHGAGAVEAAEVAHAQLATHPENTMVPFLTTYGAGAIKTEPAREGGEVFVFVLRGRFRAAPHGAHAPAVELQAGDTAYFETSTAITFENIGTGSAQLLGSGLARTAAGLDSR